MSYPTIQLAINEKYQNHEAASIGSVLLRYLLNRSWSRWPNNETRLHFTADIKSEIYKSTIHLKLSRSGEGFVFRVYPDKMKETSLLKSIHIYFEYSKKGDVHNINISKIEYDKFYLSRLGDIVSELVVCG